MIGRSVETALLSALAGDAEQHGARTLAGEFLPTRKNVPAQDFYAAHGFVSVAADGIGNRWQVELDARTFAVPDWIELTFEQGASV